MLKLNVNNILMHKWDCILPILMFLLAFALRFNFLVTYPYPLMIHQQDAVGYMDVAKSFLQLHIPSVTGRPPGYPIIIALFALLPVELEQAARLASIFMDSMVVFPLYYLARISLERAGALAVCVIWAFFSLSLTFSTSPLSQSSYLCYLVYGIATLHLGVVTGKRKWFFSSGIFMALSFLARPEGIVGFCCGFVFCLVLLFEKGNFKKNKLVPLYFLVGFLILAGPYLIAMRISLGGWTLSALAATQVNGVETALRLNADGSLQKVISTGLAPWKQSHNSIPEFLMAVQHNFLGFASTYIDYFPTWMHLLSLFGFLTLVWRTKWRETMLLLFLPLAITPIFAVDLPKALGYIFPIFIFSFIVLINGLDALLSCCNRVVQRFLPRVEIVCNPNLWSCILFLPVIYIACMSYQGANDEYQSLIPEVQEIEQVFKAACEVIKDNTRTNDVIMTTWGLVGYFADRPILRIPIGGAKEVIEYGRKNGARFLLIDTKTALSRRPELKELLNPLNGKNVNPGYKIEKIYSHIVQDVGAYVIYEFKN